MHRLRGMLIPALLSLTAAGAGAQDNADTPDFDNYAATGPYQVSVVESLLLGSVVQGNAVETRIHYPVGEGPFPVIVFSHGLGGDKDLFTEVTSHWASHGFVTVQPSHDDSGVSFSGGGMHPPEEAIRDRLDNVITALDSIDRIEQSVPALEGTMDEQNMAVAGHSYGSFITMLTGGITVELGDRENVMLGDPRVQCIAPISPSGRGDYGMSDGTFQTLTIPALFFTGTDDQRSGRPEDWRMEPFELSPPGDKYLVVIQDAAHGDFGGDNPGSEDAPDYVKAATTAFWDYCLNGSALGKEYLDNPMGFASFAGDRATIDLK